MNKLDRPLEVTDYEADYALWCAEQGALLREGRFEFTGSRKPREEIESLGRSERYEIDSRLKVLLLHLLKWRFQPQGGGPVRKLEGIDPRATAAHRAAAEGQPESQAVSRGSYGGGI